MRFILIDDHPLMRDGIVHMLRAQWPQCEVTCAGDAPAGLKLARAGADLILLDLGLPGVQGVEALAAIREGCPAIPVVVLTASDNRHDIEACLRAGARAYVGKDAAPDALMQVLASVLAGDTVFPASPGKPGPDAESTGDGLTARQREILHLVCAGHSNKEIALRLAVSDGTVKTHVTAIFQALGVVSRTQAILVARRYGWVQAEAAEP